MNGGGEGDVMEEDGKEAAKLVLMWGYLPGASLQRSPLLQPTAVWLPESAAGDRWRDVCGGGCGFAMAISDSGKLLTWGSTDDLGQSYVTSGKHTETPEVFSLPSEAVVATAAAGWAHCVAATDHGQVYTWGWKECVPSGKFVGDQPTGDSAEKDEKQSGHFNNQVSPRSQVSRSSGGGTVSNFENKVGEESTKRRRVSSAKQAPESSMSSDESLSAVPYLVPLSTGVIITTVAAGGRHTLALSDAGQVWGWGYGGEGQLGLGSRIRMVSSPHLLPCIDSAAYGKDRPTATSRGNKISDGQIHKPYGSRIKAVSCGGRHSAVITDTGVLITFGWGLYGQCGQGSTDDELIPTCVSSLLGVKVQGVAAGLWHTICTSADGDVYAFGGNQFGQLGTGSDHAETFPKLLDAPCLENKNAKTISCGARHSAMITEDGDVFCWGWNKYGQLGLGDAVDRSTPSRVPIEDVFRPKNVSCGWWHTLALVE